MELQQDRGYELIIGDYKNGDGVLFNNLQCTFDISKSTDNKKRGNSASIEIYNLSADSLKKLETEYLAAVFSCGYFSTGIKRLFSGAVVETKTVKNGTDRVTQLLLGEGYLELNDQVLKSVVPPGKKVSDVVAEIQRQMPGVSRGAFTGTNINSPIIYGYPLTGTPKEMLDELAEAHRLEWRVDDGALFVNDEAGLVDTNYESAVVLNDFTGLLSAFYTSGEGRKLKNDPKRRQGVQFKALLNPDIRPGKIVHIETEEINGWYKVTSARYSGDFRGTNWYVEGFCDEILKGDLDNARISG